MRLLHLIKPKLGCGIVATIFFGVNPKKKIVKILENFHKHLKPQNWGGEKKTNSNIIAQLKFLDHFNSSSIIYVFGDQLHAMSSNHDPPFHTSCVCAKWLK
jgi:hypothetical protein